MTLDLSPVIEYACWLKQMEYLFMGIVKMIIQFFSCVHNNIWATALIVFKKQVFQGSVVIFQECHQGKAIQSKQTNL